MGKLALILCFILSVFPADANENRSEFIKEWKEDEWAEYIGYYFYDGRLGLLFDYYQTGREKIALEFEGILN